MKKRLKQAISILCVVAMIFSNVTFNQSEVKADGTELLSNTAFADGTGWIASGFTGDVTYSDGVMHGSVPAHASSATNYATQFLTNGIALTAGKSYVATVTINSTVARKFQVLVQGDGSEGGGGSYGDIKVSEVFSVEANTPYTCTVNFKASTVQNNYLLGIMMGAVNSEASSACDVQISGVSLKEYDTVQTIPEGYTTASTGDWVNMSAWSVYFGTWGGNPTGAYRDGGAYNDFGIYIDTAGNASWSVQMKTQALTVVSGHSYTCRLNVTSNMITGSVIEFKDEISGTSAGKLALASGSNTISLDFTAAATAQMFFDLGTAPAELQLEITSFELIDNTAADSETSTAAETTTVTETTTKTSSGPIEVIGQNVTSTKANTIAVVWGQTSEMISSGQTYNVYVDDEKKLESVICNNYELTGISAGTHTVKITSYLNGQESEGVTTTVTVQDATAAETTTTTTQTSTAAETTTGKSLTAPKNVLVEPDDDYSNFTVTFTGSDAANSYKLYLDGEYKESISSGASVNIADYDSSIPHVFAVTSVNDSEESAKAEYTVKIKNGTEVLKNTEFNGNTNWYEGNQGGETSGYTNNADGSVDIVVPAYQSGDNWATQLKQDGLKLYEGYWYVAELTITSDVDKTVEILIQHDGTSDNDWTVYSNELVELTAGTATTVQFQFQADKTTTGSVLYGLMMGYVNGKQCDAANVTIKDVSFKVYNDEQVIKGTSSSALFSNDISVKGFQIKTNWSEETDNLGFRAVCYAPEIGGKIKVGNTTYTIARIGTIETPEVDVNNAGTVYDKTCTYIKSYTLTSNQSDDDKNAEGVAPLEVIHTATSAGISSTEDGYSTYVLTLTGTAGVLHPANAIHVRAFVITTGGTIIYSKTAASTSIARVADYMYSNSMISNITGHDYLYNKILSKEEFVPSDGTGLFETKENPYYRTADQKVEYGWNGNLYTNQNAEKYTNLKPDQYLTNDYISSKSGVSEAELDSELETATEEVIATGENWKYRMSTSNDVKAGWNTLNFNDTSWSTAAAPFGDRSAYSTSWTGDNTYIWIRKTFTIENVDLYKGFQMKINTFYDDNPRFYLNGKLIYTDTEGNPWNDSYELITIPAEYSEYLREGKNVIAIQCSNDTGGRQIDTSLVLTKSESVARGTVNKTADGGILTLAGLKFDYGISANTNGYFEYKIPAGTTNFVGIVGTDESSDDGSTVDYQISVDGEILSSGTVDKGDLDIVNIDIKKDSQIIKILFTGSGIATMANAGWMIDDELAENWNDTSNDPDDITRIYVNIDGDYRNITKADKTEASLMVISADGSVNSIASTSGAIKLRGNSTSIADKKAYNIYFDSKVELFKGQAKGKKWCLLANAYDKSLIRNKLALDLAKNIGLEVATPDSHFVDLYINGQLIGSYLATEPADNGRSGISYDESNDKDILFELDVDTSKNEDGVLYYTTGLGLRFATEDTTDTSSAKYNNWVSTLSAFETALQNTSSNDVFNYIDKDSFVDMYIINELFKTVDFGYSSVKFYTNYDAENDKVIIHAGCLWDFDLSAGNSQFADIIDADSEGDGTLRCQNVNRWFGLLMQNATFVQAVKDRYAAIQDNIVNMYQDNTLGTNQIDALLAVIGKSKDRNYTSVSEGGAGWSATKADSAEYNVYAYGYNTVSPYSEYTYDQHISFLRNWLSERNTYLLTKWELD